QNLGTADLELIGTKVGIIGNSDFTVTVQPTSPIAPNSIATFEIAFDPNVTGIRTATISIANNDSDKNPYEFNIQGTGRVKPNKPLCITPEDNKQDLILNPFLIASAFSDQDQGDTQTGSEWQIFISDQEITDLPIFQQIINNLSQNASIPLIKIQIPWGTLKTSTTYKWRVRYRDNYGPWWSEWSDFQYLTTILTDQEYEVQKVDPPAKLVDADIRGAVSSESTGNKAIAFACDNQNIMVKSIDPKILPDEGKPTNLPYGLFSIRIDDLSTGATTTVIYYLPGNYEGGVWYKYDSIIGWYQYDNITFTYNPDTGYTLAKVTLKDGGDGDFDGMENGVIVDPGGPSLPNTNNSTEDDGCFISNIFQCVN
ncbi:MAG: choice-of-anchor U domain-containing protein, partial [bacterium]